MDEHWNQDERLYDAGINGPVIALTGSIYRIGSLVRRKGHKPHRSRSVRAGFGNIVLRVLIPASDGLCGIHIEVPVQLENIGGANRDILIVLMDGIQHVPVAHDLLFVSVSGCSLFLI